MDSEATQGLSLQPLREAAGHPEEEKEEDDAAGTVYTLSNKANHPALVLY